MSFGLKDLDGQVKDEDGEIVSFQRRRSTIRLTVNLPRLRRPGLPSSFTATAESDLGTAVAHKVHNYLVRRYTSFLATSPLTSSISK